MINSTYPGLVWKTNKGFTIFSMFFIVFMQFLVLYIITTIDTTSIITSILSQLPEKVRIFINDSFLSTLTFDGAAAFGLNHPTVIAIVAIAAINIPVRHISREIEDGTMELLLSHPFKRTSLIFKLWISGSLILLVIALTGFLSSVFAIHIFHDLTVTIGWRLAQICINFWLLFMVIMSYTLLITTASKAGSFASNLSAGITLMFYLLFFIGQLWDTIAFLKPYSIFTYFQPQKLMFGQGDFWGDILVLGCITLICFAGSLWFFKRRDIP